MATEGTMNDIYLLIEGQQQGPYSEKQVRQSLAVGFIRADFSGWHEGLSGWTPLSDILRNDEWPPSISTPPVPALATVPPPFSPAIGNLAQGTQYPWYRSSIFVGLIIGVPWLLGPYFAVFLKPFMIVGLILVATGSIYYTKEGAVKTLPSWNRWLAVGLLLLAVPYYFSILFEAVHPVVPSTAITTALQQDDRLGNQYHDQLKQITGDGDDRLDQVARLTRELASKMKAIPIGGCPSDFQEAYTRHINCWSDLADIVAQHPHVQSGDEAFLEGVMRGMAGDPTGGAFERQDEVNSYLNNTATAHLAVKRSWEDVEAIAIKYGVQESAYTSN